MEESFEPLLFGIDMNITNIKNINDLKQRVDMLEQVDDVVFEELNVFHEL